MRIVRQLALLGCVSLATVTACGDSGGDDGSGVVGVWNAVSFLYTDIPSGESVELMAEGGLAEFTMTITSENDVIFSAREQGEEEPDLSRATMVRSGSTVTLTFSDGTVSRGTLTQRDDELTLTISSYVEGTEPEERITIVFVRD